MATYYISPTGNNNDAGSYASPWAPTAVQSTTKFTAGDTVVFKEGLYEYSGASGVPWLLLYKSGTAGNPVVITSETKWGAILDCKDLAQYAFMVKSVGTQ